MSYQRLPYRKKYSEIGSLMEWPLDQQGYSLIWAVKSMFVIVQLAALV